MDDMPWMAFARLRYEHPENALRDTAELVRSGCTDPLFLRLLAAHIDPDLESSPFGTKFELHRTTGRKSPPKTPNHLLREFLERFIDIFPDGEPTEAVKAEAMRRFGVSRSTCGVELAASRRAQKRSPDLFEMRKQAAQTFREYGDPDFQPLWPDK